MTFGINLFWLDEAEPERHKQDIDIRYQYHAGTDMEVRGPILKRFGKPPPRKQTQGRSKTGSSPPRTSNLTRATRATPVQVGLAWSRYEQQMVFDGLRAAGDTDIVMLSRSFFVGGARLGAAAWSGDVPSTFESLHQQVRWVAQTPRAQDTNCTTPSLIPRVNGNVLFPRTTDRSERKLDHCLTL
jgi:alpha-glucosidase (family GH31 glycosyl hydrolase)